MHLLLFIRQIHWGWLVTALLAVYLITAYVILPRMDEHRARHHPARFDEKNITQTGTGLPGDPLNLALVGTEEAVIRALIAAGWRPANALSFRSSARIVLDTVIDEPDPNAPVSNLYLYGRIEDHAFEKPIGNSPKERHHVRLWRSNRLQAGQPLWMCAATHDVGVEFSHTTGQVTHRIAPDVDLERDLLLTDLTATKRISATQWIANFHPERQGRNGGGDSWHTDGRLPIATLSADHSAAAQ